MKTRTLDRTLSFLGVLSAFTVLLMVIAILLTKSSQDFFQSARPIGAYAAHIAETPLAALGLRWNLGLDGMFIIFYCSFFTVLATRFGSLLATRILTVALAAMLLTGLLDAIENHHIMLMLHSIENGLPVSVAEGQAQMAASQVKFHASYLSAFLFSFGFWQMGRLGRITAISLWCYIPLGVMISVLPVEATKALVLGRTVFFVFAFILSAILFARSARAGEASLGSQF